MQQNQNPNSTSGHPNPTSKRTSKRLRAHAVSRGQIRTHQNQTPNSTSGHPNSIEPNGHQAHRSNQTNTSGDHQCRSFNVSENDSSSNGPTNGARKQEHTHRKMSKIDRKRPPRALWSNRTFTYFRASSGLFRDARPPKAFPEVRVFMQPVSRDHFSVGPKFQK